MSTEATEEHTMRYKVGEKVWYYSDALKRRLKCTVKDVYDYQRLYGIGGGQHNIYYFLATEDKLEPVTKKSN